MEAKVAQSGFSWSSLWNRLDEVSGGRVGVRHLRSCLWNWCDAWPLCRHPAEYRRLSAGSLVNLSTKACQPSGLQTDPASSWFLGFYTHSYSPSASQEEIRLALPPKLQTQLWVTCPHIRSTTTTEKFAQVKISLWLPGLPCPEAGVSLTACVLSPLLFRGRLSLLFSLLNTHYSSVHSSLAHLCPLPL